MRIPESKVSEILQVADILEVIQDYVQLKKRGSNWTGLSPFKTEKTPSFVVSPSKNIFKDFSSGKGGNVISFLMELEGFTYPEALLHLARKYHIEVETFEDPEYRDQESRKQSLYILNDFATKYFSRQLQESEEGKLVGLSYFKERGISEESIEKFQLGYSPDAWDGFTRHALEAQYGLELLLHSGLTFQPEGSERTLDRFRGRIIFPIHNPIGKITGFGGRILQSDARAAKYVNSPESDIYHKSEVLYGLYFAREEIRQNNEVLLTEGYLDVISLHQRGIRQVVAASGTALSEFQVKSLARLTKNVVLINDADKAGISASLRAIDLLLEKDMQVHIVLLPEGEDPDSFVRTKGVDAFRDYVRSQKKDFLDFKIDTAPESMLTPAGKAALVDSIATSIAHIPNPILMQAWVQECAKRLNFPEQTILSAVNRFLIEAGRVAARAKAREEGKGEVAQGQDSQFVPALPAFIYNPFDSSAQEKELLRIMVNHFNEVLKFPVKDQDDIFQEVGLMQYLFVEMSDFEFTNTLYNKLKLFLFDKVQSHSELQLEDLLNNQDPEIAYLVSELLVIRNEISENWSKFDHYVPVFDSDLIKIVDSALHRFICYHLDRMLKHIEQKLREAIEGQFEDDKINELMKQYNRLKQLDKEHNQKAGTVIKRI